MLSTILLEAESRKNIGTRNSKRFRKINKQIPAIIYEKNKESISILIDHNKFNCIIKNKNNYKEQINIKLNSEIYLVKIKEIQYHQCKPIILHIDFIKINTFAQ